MQSGNKINLYIEPINLSSVLLFLRPYMEYFIIFDFGYNHQKNFVSQITYDVDNLGYPFHNQWRYFYDPSVYGI